MEQQLEEVQGLFNDENMKAHVEEILDSYLQKTNCGFTPFEKSAIPICAAYFSVQEQLYNQQQNHSKEGSIIFKQPSLMDMRNKCYREVDLLKLIQTAIQFAKCMKAEELTEQIVSKLESLTINYRLFCKFQQVFNHFCNINDKQSAEKAAWIIFLLLKENIGRQQLDQKEDVEKCSYLLNYVCSKVVKQFEDQKDENISDKVYTILYKGKLDSLKMKEMEEEFDQEMQSLTNRLKLKEALKEQNSNIQEEEMEQQNNQDNNKEIQIQEENKESFSPKDEQQIDSLLETSDFFDLFSTNEKIEALIKLLEKEADIQISNTEERDFLLREDFQQSMLTTPKAACRISVNPPGMTLEHQDAKLNNSHQNDSKGTYKRSLIFSDERPIDLNSKLSELDPMKSPLPPNNSNLPQLGLFQQQMTPKTPHENPSFKMPHLRGQHQQFGPLITAPQFLPTTPHSAALENCKWFNMYSKQEQTKRIDELMAKIDKHYKQKIIEQIQSVAREVFFSIKKKNENNGTSPQNDVDFKVNKTVLLFQNVLEHMISDEEQRNCKESQLIQLLDNRNFISSLLANCIMTMCFIRGIKEITLDILLKECQISSLDFWRIISNFAKFDRRMPEAIRENLFNLEKQILLYTIWEEKEEFIQNALVSFQDETIKRQNYDGVLCRRLISHSATRVKELCKVLQLSEEIQERVWEALLFVYRSQIYLMKNRYVDQILICSIYALKLIKKELFNDKEIKFKGMITACEKLLHFNAEKVKKSINAEGESIDIVTFYNKIYLIPMKQYFKTSCTSNTLSNIESSPQKSLFSVSLNKSIPENFKNYTPLLKDEIHSYRNQDPMTPMTQKLQAPSEVLESPYPAKHHGSIFGNKGQLANRDNKRQYQQQQQQESQKEMQMKTIAVFGQIGVNENGNSSSKTQVLFNEQQQQQQITPTPHFGSVMKMSQFNSKDLIGYAPENHQTSQFSSESIVKQRVGVSNPNFSSDEGEQDEDEQNNTIITKKNDK